MGHFFEFSGLPQWYMKVQRVPKFLSLICHFDYLQLIQHEDTLKKIEIAPKLNLNLAILFNSVSF